MDHEDIIDAFRKAEPKISVCSRGGNPPAYSHIHSPNQAVGASSCRSHWIVVECANGAVALRGALAQHLGAKLRPNLAITTHPTGHSAGPKYGDFDHALDPTTIAARWPSADALVRDVLAACRTVGAW